MTSFLFAFLRVNSRPIVLDLRLSAQICGSSAVQLSAYRLPPRSPRGPRSPPPPPRGPRPRPPRPCLRPPPPPCGLPPPCGRSERPAPTVSRFASSRLQLGSLSSSGKSPPPSTV